MKIEKLIYGGFGLSHNENGTPVFVYKSVPGDEAETRTVESKRSFDKAIIKKIIKPSADRIEPVCPHYFECGGCEHMNMPYDKQLFWKNEIFVETLKRAKITTRSLPIISGSKNNLNYRNVIRFTMKCNDQNMIEYQMHNFIYNNNDVPINECHLISKISNQILNIVRQTINENIEDKKSFWQLRIREGSNTGQIMVEIMTDSPDLPQRDLFIEKLTTISEVKSVYHTFSHNRCLRNLKRKLIYGSPIITEKIGCFKFNISPESFFQTNSYGVKTLYDTVKSFAEIKPNERLLDLYCGTGTIGIYLSTLAQKVFGVDLEANAIKDAIGNCRVNHIENCEFTSDDAERYLARNRSEFDIIIIDPPRHGLNASIIKMLCNIKPKKIIYVSCNPTTFARDIKEFEKRSIYLKKVQPIDMFPQTHHIECVGQLSGRPDLSTDV